MNSQSIGETLNAVLEEMCENAGIESIVEDRKVRLCKHIIIGVVLSEMDGEEHAYTDDAVKLLKVME